MSGLHGTRVLVTGGRGFIGAALTPLLVDEGALVTRIGRTAPTAPLRGIADVVGDIRDRATWDKLVSDADVVIHLAGQTSLYAAEAEPIADHAHNVEPVLHLLAAARAAGRKPHVVLAATVTQFGLPRTLPVNEDAPNDIRSVYDLHKLAAETHLLLAQARGDITACSLRLPNIYGPGPRSGSGDRGVLNAMVRRALAGEHLTVWGEGAHLRDYLFVKDAARAFALAAGRPDRARAAFALGTGIGTRLVDALTLARERVAALGGPRVQVQHVPTPSTMHVMETRDFVADPRRFREATGWSANVALAEGIDQTIQSYQGDPL